MAGWFLTTRSFILALLVHLLFVGFMAFSIEFKPKPVLPKIQKINTVKAISVDKQRVEAELERLKQIDQNKKAAEKRRQQEWEQKAKKIEAKRKQEEQRLKDLQKKKEKQKQARLKEEKRLKALEIKRKEEETKQKNAEEQRKAEEKKRAQIEQERQQLEKEKKRQAAELEKLAEKRQQEEAAAHKAEQEKRLREAEELMQQELEAERKAEQEAQNRLDARIIAQFGDRIKRMVINAFNLSGFEKDNLSAELYIRMIPGGDVVDVRILKSSGNSLFDRRAITAVQKASPFPAPEEKRIFEKVREIRFLFQPGL